MNEYCFMEEIFETIPEIDFNIGYNYYFCNIDNYSNALLSTLKSIKSKLTLLKSMIEASNYDGLRMITQTLRSKLITVGGTSVAELSYQLEASLLNEDEELNDKLTEYFLALEDLVLRMEELIKKLGVQHMRASLEKKGLNYHYIHGKTSESI